MEFTVKEADLLKETLAAVSSDPQRAAELFYVDLFERLPETKALFVSDMGRQGEKLIATLSAVVLQIKNWASIQTQIEDLGLRHVAYGVQSRHYTPTGKALIAMLSEVHGEAFTEEHRAAWQKAYDAVADAMITAIDKRKSTPSRDEA